MFVATYMDCILESMSVEKLPTTKNVEGFLCHGISLIYFRSSYDLITL